MQSLFMTVLLALLCAWSVQCSTSGETAIMNLTELDDLVVRDYEWRTTEHHDPKGGFRNIWGPYDELSGWDAAGWIMGSSWRGEKFNPTKFRALDPGELTRPYSGRYRAAWFGQATVLIQSQGKVILTDPLFEQRASPVSFSGPKRLVGVPLALEKLPALDVVLISHNHYDHLSGDAIRRLVKRYDPVFLVPLGLGKLMKSWGASRVRELDWWQYVDVAGHRFSATPVQHFSARGAFDRNATLWAGWYIEARDTGLKVYFAGDTGYGPFFRETRERLGVPDLALIPIGAYLPRWFMKIVHVNPAEALQAYDDLQARRMLPIHWGTYDLADEALHRPLEEMKELMGDRKGILTDLPVGGVFED